MSTENAQKPNSNSSAGSAKLPVSRRAKRFNWKEFKKYVETYDPEKHGGNNAETIFQDMLYGIGISVDKKYRFADGFHQFKQWLVARLHGG